MNFIPRMSTRVRPNVFYHSNRTFFKKTKMRSSLFGLPMVLGTWLGVYIPCTTYVLVFSKKFEPGDPIEYERNVRGRKV